MGVMKLYGSSDSGNCMKARWVAERVGRAFDWIETSTYDGATRSPEFLALNPAGQVPIAVMEDGRILAQSNAIMLFLAEGSPLIPADAFARAKMYEWLFWEQYSHEPYVAVRIARLHYLKLSERDLDPALKVKGEAALARLELHLKQAQFLVGEALTLADIALVAYTRNAPKGGFDLDAYPATAAWVRRVEAALGLKNSASAKA